MVGGANVGAGPNAGPKILLAKPASSRSENSAGATTSGAPAAVVKLMRERDDENSVRTRLPHGSLSLISESWEIYPDRLLPLMSDNSDFTVIGVLGPSGVGKSTILNELYGFDANSPGVLPPFSVLSDESKAMARHCSVGVELRMSAERFILLDTQPLFSASVLTDLMRPDGSSSISVLAGESLPAELAHEMMGIQLGVFLASVCHVLLLVTEGLHDISLWRLMLTATLVLFINCGLGPHSADHLDAVSESGHLPALFGIRARLISLLREFRSKFFRSTYGFRRRTVESLYIVDAGGDHNEDYGNEYGPPLPTQEELCEMEDRRLVGEATNMMLNFAKDPKLAKYMTETAFQDVHAQWKATTTSPPKSDSKKQYSEKELEEEVEARLARILGAQDKSKKHDKKQKKSTDFPVYLGSQSTFDKAKKHRKHAEVPSSSSSSDNSSDLSEEERKGKKRSKKQRHGKGKKKTRKSKSRRVDDSSTNDTSTDSSDFEDGYFYANKKNFYKANQYDFLEDRSKKVREFKEG
ncbi:hypothetical protein L7F22_063061 [Adiantum nelumboides]|nr:hypothetical protein [Adiantum nelumboides]